MGLFRRKARKNKERILPDEITLMMTQDMQYDVMHAVHLIVPEGYAGTVKVSVLDHNYKKWLSGMEDNDDARCEYANSLSKAQRDDLMAKNGFDYTIYCFALANAYAGDIEGEMEFNVSKETIKATKKLFEDVFGMDAYVSPYMMSADSYAKRRDRLQMMAYSYFKMNKAGRIEAFKTDHFDGAYGGCYLYLPVFLCEKLNGSEIDCRKEFVDSHKLHRDEFIYAIEDDLGESLGLDHSIKIPNMDSRAKDVMPLVPLLNDSIVSFDSIGEFEEDTEDTVAAAMDEFYGQCYIDCSPKHKEVE